MMPAAKKWIKFNLKKERVKCKVLYSLSAIYEISFCECLLIVLQFYIEELDISYIPYHISITRMKM